MTQVEGAAAPPKFGLGFELPRDIVRMLGPGLFGHPGDGEQRPTAQ